jgi:uncharacterized protein YbjT (DUF2867 family)
MFVVAGVSGNTGRVVANELLGLGKKVRVVVRNQEKGAEWAAKGAEVAVANLDDAQAMAKAFAGAEGASLLLPPDPASPDPVGRNKRVADALFEALTASPVPHVAFLSSVGAQHADGTGPIKSLAYAEKKFAGLTGTRFTFVRAAYFMENLGGVAGAAKAQGVLPAFFDPKKKIPMVATYDIGHTLARALLEPAAANTVLELDGPEQYSFEDAAKLFAAALGKAVHPVHVPPQGIAPALIQAGLPAPMAELYREMSVGVESNHVAFEGKSNRHRHGAVPLSVVVRALVG